MANEKYGLSEVVNLINERMNNATPGTAVFAELAKIKEMIYQNLLSTRMEAAFPPTRDFIKEVMEKRFNPDFWKVGDAYSIRFPDRYIDVILCETFSDDYGITRLRFVAGVNVPGSHSNGFSLDVWTYTEDGYACIGGTHIDHTVIPGEELIDVSYKIFNTEWFEKESADWVDFECTVMSRALIKVEFRGGTIIGFVDPREIREREFDIFVGPKSISIYPTPEEMYFINIQSLKYLKEENK